MNFKDKVTIDEAFRIIKEEFGQDQITIIEGNPDAPEVTRADKEFIKSEIEARQIPRDGSKKGLSFRSAPRQASGDMERQRGLSFREQARAMGSDDQEIGT